MKAAVLWEARCLRVFKTFLMILILGLVRAYFHSYSET